MEEPKEPTGDVLFQLYSLVASEAQREEMAALYRRGGFGYGEVKKTLADAAEAYFAEVACATTLDWEHGPTTCGIFWQRGLESACQGRRGIRASSGCLWIEGHLRFNRQERHERQGIQKDEYCF